MAKGGGSDKGHLLGLQQLNLKATKRFGILTNRPTCIPVFVMQGADGDS